MSSGEAFSDNFIEAIKIMPLNGHISVNYAVFSDAFGWSSEASNGTLAGSTGKSAKILAVRIYISGQSNPELSILYRVFTSVWSDWHKDNQIIFENAGFKAIQIKIACS